MPKTTETIIYEYHNNIIDIKQNWYSQEEVDKIILDTANEAGNLASTNNKDIIYKDYFLQSYHYSVLQQLQKELSFLSEWTPLESKWDKDGNPTTFTNTEIIRKDRVDSVFAKYLQSSDKE